MQGMTISLCTSMQSIDILICTAVGGMKNVFGHLKSKLCQLRDLAPREITCVVMHKRNDRIPKPVEWKRAMLLSPIDIKGCEWSTRRSAYVALWDFELPPQKSLG